MHDLVQMFEIEAGCSDGLVTRKAYCFCTSIFMNRFYTVLCCVKMEKCSFPSSLAMHFLPSLDA